MLGLLAPQLQHDIGWNEIQYADIITAFTAAYALGLLMFGWIVDRIGTKRGYSVAVTCWSVAAMSHALARTVFGFGAARFGLGLGEAGNFPSAVKSVAEWFPRKERALAAGIFNSGANVGAVLAPLVVPWLAVTFGWQSAFIALGALGFIWLIFWGLIYDSPHRKKISASELAHIQGDGPVEPPGRGIPWVSLLGYRQTWAYAVGMALSAPVWWFYLYWLPKFLHTRHGLDISTMGPPLVVIYSMTCVGSVGGGWLSSSLIKRGWTVNASRKTAMLVCALCVVPVIFAATTPSLWLATFLIGLAASAHQGWSANLFTLASDLFPAKAVASVVGIGGMLGSLVSMLFAQSAGFILQATGSYWSLFLMCGFVYLVALLIIHFLVPRMEPLVLS